MGFVLSRFIFRPIAQLLQSYDKMTVDRVDLFLANSRYVAERVRRIYAREALVLAPPVNTERFIAMRREPEDWYLVVSAMVPYKRVDQAIRACAVLRRRLKLVGKGPETAELKRLAEDLGADVEFLGYVSDESLGELLPPGSSVAVSWSGRLRNRSGRSHRMWLPGGRARYRGRSRLYDPFDLSAL